MEYIEEFNEKPKEPKKDLIGTEIDDMSSSDKNQPPSTFSNLKTSNEYARNWLTTEGIKWPRPKLFDLVFDTQKAAAEKNRDMLAARRKKDNSDPTFSSPSEEQVFYDTIAKEDTVAVMSWLDKAMGKSKGKSR